MPLTPDMCQRIAGNYRSEEVAIIAFTKMLSTSTVLNGCAKTRAGILATNGLYCKIPDLMPNCNQPANCFRGWVGSRV